MKTTKKLLSALVVCTLAVPMLGTGVNAKENDLGSVRVIIENNTLSEENGADWTGTLADQWVTITEDDSAITAFMQVVDAQGFSQTGAQEGYISEINGLSAEDGGAMGGWMFSLDDWFTDEGIAAYTVSSGKLEDGDELRFSYSCAWGGDLDYDWSGADTSLKNVVFSAGELDKTFEGTTYDYVLTLPEETEAITVRPEVLNKAYRSKVYKNTYTPAEKGTDYKSGKEIEITDGDVIIIGVASPAWMQSNYNNAQESIYRFHISEVRTTDPVVQEAESLINAIGMITLESRDKIKAARSFFDSLTDEQMSKVSNYELLVNAEEEYAGLLPDMPNMELSELREAAGQYLSKEPVFGNEWDMIALTRLGLASDSMKEGYIASVREKLAEGDSPRLSATRSTVNSGVVAALTAAGADPTDFYGYDLTQPLTDIEYVTSQGVNGAVYALIALDSHGYGNDDIRAKLISVILAAQESDGGWTIDTWTGIDDGSDADMTAMALQALAPYAGTDDNVREASSRALDFLEKNQTDLAGFVSYGSEDCESCAQVMTALCALNIDPETDEKFTASGYGVFRSLQRFYNSDDMGFTHLLGGESNYISSYQAYISVAAYYRLVNGMTSLFDMSDTELAVFRAEEASTTESSTQSSAPVVVPDEKPVPTGEPSAPAMTLILALFTAAAAAVILRGRRAE